MKKIMIIDGGPRKAMNTAAMAEAFAKGAESASDEVEVKHIRLYDIDYKGCVSCLACKVKNSKYTSYCAYKDGITDILKEAAFADGIVFASPIYFSDITAQLRAFTERLFFPWLSYNDYSTHAPNRIPTAFIYTMNATKEYLPQMENAFERIESMIALCLQKPERMVALNTTQVKDYDRYDMAGFSKEAKQMWRDTHWEEDLQNSFDAGRRMVGKIMTA